MFSADFYPSRPDDRTERFFLPSATWKNSFSGPAWREGRSVKNAGGIPSAEGDAGGIIQKREPIISVLLTVSSFLMP